MSPEARRRVDRLATLFLLVPLFAVLAWLTVPEAVGSFRVGETSPQIGGLPGYWAVRFVPILAAVLALVQGIARVAGPQTDGAR